MAGAAGASSRAVVSLIFRHFAALSRRKQDNVPYHLFLFFAFCPSVQYHEEAGGRPPCPPNRNGCFTCQGSLPSSRRWTRRSSTAPSWSGSSGCAAGAPLI